MNMTSSTALVTGGAVRIGRAICEALAARGCHVVVHYHRSAAQAKALCRDLEKKGVRAYAVQGELGSAAGCERVLREAQRKAGSLDILINSAAVFHKDTIESATEKKLLSELQINLVAPMMLTKAFARRWREKGRVSRGKGRKERGQAAVLGKVVNLLDRRIAGNDPSCVPYVLSKKMLAEFTRSAALELAPRMTVNGVAPGAILPPPGRGAGRVRDLAGQSPLKRQCTPAEVAAAVVFLLESDAITGQTIFVDGGQHLLG
jgi:NAD(P)-dependent dehydrogenase (short-subunit alcohol dehydrogenase family)